MELRFPSRRWCETDGRTHGPWHPLFALRGTGPELHRTHGIEMRTAPATASILVSILNASTSVQRTLPPVSSAASKLSSQSLELPLSPASWRGGRARRSISPGQSLALGIDFESVGGRYQQCIEPSRSWGWLVERYDADAGGWCHMGQPMRFRRSRRRPSSQQE
jgi:hypothetical protein